MRRGMTRRDFLQEAALATAVLGLGGDLLSACRGAATGSQPAPPALKRDSLTLVYAVDNFTPDFDPASYYVNSPAHLTRSMYEGLLSMKPGSATETQPALATSYQASPDFATWTFAIRQGVSFWDGTALDAAAIKAAYVRSIRLALGAGSVIGTFVSNPEQQIVAVDPATLRFDLGQPVSYFNLVVASIWGTGVNSPKVQQHSTGSSDQGHQWLQSNAAGTGPYMLDSVQPGNQAVLVQNPNYWGGWKANQFKKVIIQQIPDGAARREALQTGAIDMAVNSANAQDTVAVIHDKRFNVATRLAMWMEFIVLANYGPLEKAEARQAVNYLYPGKAYVSSIMKDTVAPAHGCFPRLMQTQDPNAYVFPTDIDKAKQLFAQAGVAPGTNFTYEYYTGYGNLLGAVMQVQFQKAGMVLKLAEKAFAAFNADQTTFRPISERPHMFFWSWYPDYNQPADYLYPIANSAAVPPNGYNSGYYNNPTVDKAINDGYFQPDQAKLEQTFTQVQDIINRQDPMWVPVDQAYDNTYTRNDIGGLVPNPLTGGVEDLYPLHRL